MVHKGRSWAAARVRGCAKGRHRYGWTSVPTVQKQKQSSQSECRAGPCQNTLYNRSVIDACSSTRGACFPILSVERCKECFLITVNKAGKILFITQMGRQPATSRYTRPCNSAGLTQHTLPATTGRADTCPPGAQLETTVVRSDTSNSLRPALERTRQRQ